jgi:phosphoglycolate phosphatase
MPRVKLILFDLDGTLVDSVRDIASSVNELLERLGRPALPPKQIQSYVGDGVRKLLERSLESAPDSDLAREEEAYLSIYRRRLLDTTRPYPGVVPALEALNRTHRLAVLTNKPVMESRLLLEGLGLSRYFRVAYGGDSFARKKPDPLGVRMIQKELEAEDRTTLLVGDSSVDYRTAKNAGILCCLVRYGLGPWNEAEESPDFIVDDLRELAALVHSGSTAS